MDGVINIYKEKGYTSHDVVAILKKLLQCKKVGHAGTLDPDAEGVLVALVGRATKLSDYLMADNKEYRAEITFGIETDTYDSSGKVLKEVTPSFSENALLQAITDFVGEQEQMPPMFSALKVNGKKLYEIARNGITVERKKRIVFIEEIILEQFNGFNKAVIYIKCGKGTYIRSLCHDIGALLGSGAHMSALTRTKSGAFNSTDGIRLSDLKQITDKSSCIMSMEEALKGYAKITVRGGLEKILYNGGKINAGHFDGGGLTGNLAAVYDAHNNLVGIYDVIKDEKQTPLYIKPRTMLFGQNNKQKEMRTDGL